MISLVINDMTLTERREFIDAAHTWCSKQFGPRTDYRKLFHRGRWEHNPEPYGGGSQVFIFFDPKDAILFKIKFGTFVRDFR